MASDVVLQELSGLGQKERIAILLAEYSSLRTETVARTGFAFQIGAVAAVTTTWLVQQAATATMPFAWYFWLGLGFIVCGALLYAFLNGRDIARAAGRVREIEKEINSRAGEHLLRWEQVYGGGRKGGLRNVFGTLRAGSELDLAPLNGAYLERERKLAQQTLSSATATGPSSAAT